MINFKKLKTQNNKIKILFSLNTNEFFFNYVYWIHIIININIKTNFI